MSLSSLVLVPPGLDRFTGQFSSFFRAQLSNPRLAAFKPAEPSEGDSIGILLFLLRHSGRDSIRDISSKNLRKSDLEGSHNSLLDNTRPL